MLTSPFRSEHSTRLLVEAAGQCVLLALIRSGFSLVAILSSGIFALVSSVDALLSATASEGDFWNHRLPSFYSTGCGSGAAASEGF